MDRVIGKQWCEALRSGKFKRGKGKLCTVKGKTSKYCCLGVLCHILKTPYEKTIDGYKKYLSQSQNALPENVRINAKMYSSLGNNLKNSYEGFTQLSRINDETNFTFKQIADIIEENIDNL